MSKKESYPISAWVYNIGTNSIGIIIDICPYIKAVEKIPKGLLLPRIDISENTKVWTIRWLNIGSLNDKRRIATWTIDDILRTPLKVIINKKEIKELKLKLIS